ncbi:MAG: hypothetical protein FJX35_24730 [Alphaproteobacteria bacterium]|nr:hypothetical protein [Alphaproteobacteria bacterium]
MVEDFRAFLRVIYSDWVAFVSGSFTVPFLAAAILFPREPVPNFWGMLAALAGFIAALRAWQVEHKQRLALAARIVNRKQQQEMLDELSKYLGRSKSLLAQPVTDQHKVQDYVDGVNDLCRSVLAFLATNYSIAEANTWYSVSEPPYYPHMTMYPAAQKAGALLAVRHDRLADFIRFKQKDLGLAVES